MLLTLMTHSNLFGDAKLFIPSLDFTGTWKKIYIGKEINKEDFFS